MVVPSVAAFERFFREAAGLDVDKNDLKRYQSFVRHKIGDLLTAAQVTARANGRDVIERRDLPITKGLQESIHAFHRLESFLERRPMLEAIVTRPELDLGVADETDASARRDRRRAQPGAGASVRIIDPNVRNAQTRHWQQAEDIFDLLL